MEALNNALTKCRETHTGVNPCYDRLYLMARFEYHKLLVKFGILDRRLADLMRW